MHTASGALPHHQAHRPGHGPGGGYPGHGAPSGSNPFHSGGSYPPQGPSSPSGPHHGAGGHPHAPGTPLSHAPSHDSASVASSHHGLAPLQSPHGSGPFGPPSPGGAGLYQLQGGPASPGSVASSRPHGPPPGPPRVIGLHSNYPRNGDAPRPSSPMSSPMSPASPVSPFAVPAKYPQWPSTAPQPRPETYGSPLVPLKDAPPKHLFDPAAVQRHIKVAVGAKDRPHGVEHHLRGALHAAFPGRRDVLDAELARFLKDEYYVGRAVSNWDLQQYIEGLPHEAATGGVPLETLFHLLLTPDPPPPPSPPTARPFPPGTPLTGSIPPGALPPQPALPPHTPSMAGRPGPQLVESPRRGPQGLEHFYERIGQALKGDRRDARHFKTMSDRLRLQLDTADATRPEWLTVREFVTTMRRFKPPMGLSQEELVFLFQQFDPSRSGFLEIVPFWNVLQLNLTRGDGPTVVDLKAVLRKISQSLAIYDKYGGTAVGLGRAFREYDYDHDGHLTEPQLRLALKECRVKNLTNNELSALFDEFDHHRRGKISIAEFIEEVYRDMRGPAVPAAAIHKRVAGCLPRHKLPILSHQFQLVDTDGDGLVTKRQFILVLQGMDVRCKPEELGILFEMFDPHHTGRVSVKEFLASVYSTEHR